MSSIGTGGASLPLDSGVLRMRKQDADAGVTGGGPLVADTETVPTTERRWNPIGIGTAVLGGSALALGSAMMRSKGIAAGAPYALMGLAGAIVGATNLRYDHGPKQAESATLDGTRASTQAGDLSVSYGDPDDPRLAPMGTDRTNLPKDDFTTDGTAQSREGVVQVRSDLGEFLDIGSGWVVRPGLVVTNHHVIANSDDAKSIVARDHEGKELTATIVADDPDHDLALLSVPGLDDKVLPMDDVVERGEMTHVTGYPGDAFRESLAMAFQGADVHDNGVTRDGILFAGRSAPGASGGPIINASGEVVGTTFAIGASDITTGTYSGPIVMGITNGDVQKLVDGYAPAD